MAAAEPSAADKETSRDLYAEGVKALDAADFATAERTCGGAYRLVNAPTGALCWARALEGLGKLVEARDTYLAAARYPSKLDEPATFTSARADASAAADAVEPHIPTLLIVVSGAPTGANLRATIDGHDVDASTISLPRKANPGEHVVVVSARGFHDQRAAVRLADGERKRVSIAMHATASRSPMLAYVTLGAGLAVLTVGSVFGVMALGSDKSTLSKECGTPSTCPASAGNDIDTLHAHEIAADVGFGVGVVALGLGAVLLLTSSNNEDHSDSRTGSTWPLRPLVGLGSVGLGGRFQ